MHKIFTLSLLTLIKIITGFSKFLFRGDPDKADLFGNTALHLAAAQGHKSVVTFLVNFGCNIFAMDIDGRTPQELAGMNSRDEILRYLDSVQAKIEAGDKKKVKAMKEKAKKDVEKRIKVEYSIISSCLIKPFLFLRNSIKNKQKPNKMPKNYKDELAKITSRQ